MKAIISYTGTMILMYLASSLFNWSIIFKEWNWFFRLIFTLLSVGYVIIIIDELKNFFNSWLWKK